MINMRDIFMKLILNFTPRFLWRLNVIEVDIDICIYIKMIKMTRRIRFRMSARPFVRLSVQAT